MRRIISTPDLDGALKTGDGQTLLTLPGIHERLPSWLGRYDATTKSLACILEAMKVATESQLEESVPQASISVPLPFVPAHKDALHSAASSLSLHTPVIVAGAGVLAAMARGIGKNCDQDPEQLVLAINYGRAALTALLLEVECGVFEYKRKLHDPYFGSDNVTSRCKFEGTDECVEGLKTALQHFTTLPVSDDGDAKRLEIISELVLYSEGAANRRLKEVLQEVILDQYDGHFDNDNGKRTKSFDPVYAAAQTLARTCWEHHTGCLIEPKPSSDDGDRHSDLR